MAQMFPPKCPYPLIVNSLSATPCGLPDPTDASGNSASDINACSLRDELVNRGALFEILEAGTLEEQFKQAETAVNRLLCDPLARVVAVTTGGTPNSEMRRTLFGASAAGRHAPAQRAVPRRRDVPPPERQVATLHDEALRRGTVPGRGQHWCN